MSEQLIMNPATFAKILHEITGQVRFERTKQVPVAWDTLTNDQKTMRMESARRALAAFGGPMLKGFLAQSMLGWLSANCPEVFTKPTEGNGEVVEPKGEA